MLNQQSGPPWLQASWNIKWTITVGESILMCKLYCYPGTGSPQSRAWLSLERRPVTDAKSRDTPHHRRSHRDTPAWLGDRARKGTLLWPPQWQGKAGHTGLGLTSLNSFSGLWGDYSHLVPTLGWAQQRDSCSSVRAWERGGGVWFRFDLHVKSTLKCVSITA